MTNKKHPQPKVKPPKRLYYRLSEAAKELTKYFGEEITEDDLVHWGGLGKLSLFAPCVFDHLTLVLNLSGIGLIRLSKEITPENIWWLLQHFFGDSIFIIPSSYALRDIDLFAKTTRKVKSFGLAAFDPITNEVFNTLLVKGRYCFDLMIPILYWAKELPNLDIDKLNDQIKKAEAEEEFNNVYILFVETHQELTKEKLYVISQEIERIKLGAKQPCCQFDYSQIKDLINEKQFLIDDMPQPRPQKTQSELAVIAALLTNRNANSLRGLEIASDKAGYPVSKSTIGTVIERAKEIAPKCPSLRDE